MRSARNKRACSSLIASRRAHSTRAGFNARDLSASDFNARDFRARRCKTINFISRAFARRTSNARIACMRWARSKRDSVSPNATRPTSFRYDRHRLQPSLNPNRIQPTEGACAPSSRAYTAYASSALIDSARKHSPCPLITTAETQRSPGAQVRHAAESPMDPKRFHLNPRFKVVSRASSRRRMHF